MTDWDWDSILRWVERGSAVLGPLVGILIGSHLATRQSREQRRHDWVKRQIEEFYSPILGLLERALALSGLRTEIGTAADEAWRLQVEQGEITDKTEALIKAPFDRIIAYNNAQLRDEIHPLYEGMLTIFSQQYGLAEPSTRAHFPTLVHFNELWKRRLGEPLPSSVLRKLLSTPGPDLEQLHTDLVSALDRLRGELVSTKSPTPPVNA